jgi:hypothetical protein
MRSLSLLTLLLLGAASGCSKPSEPASTPAAPPPPAAPAQANPPAASASATGGNTAGGLRFSAPKPFVSRAPKSSMRAAEFGLDGDAQSELAVFYFGADQGGTVEANMSRWISQFKQPDGSEAQAKRGERSAHGIPVATVEASGTYGGGMAPPGAPAPAAITDAMLLGAIAKGPQGSVFFKLVGPRANVEAARGAFDQLVESIEASH